MPFVFDFDHAHRKPPMEMKDLLGGKGANLAEMTSVLELPVPPGLHHRHHRLPGLHGGRLARGADRRGGQGPGPAGEEDGQAHRRRRRPAAGVGAVGGQVLHAGDDGHRPQPRAQRPVGRGPGQADRRRAFRLRLLPAVRGHVRAHRARHPRGGVRHACSTRPRSWPGPRSDAGVPIELLRYLVDAYQQIVERHTGTPFPQDPDEQLRGAIEAVFASWNGPRAIAYRVRERIAHDLGTAVNVQAMVFGNRDDDSGTGVGFTRDPATGAKGEYGDFLVNAQGEDVVAGIRNTEPLSGAEGRVPEDPHASCWPSSPASRPTTATCATPSSPSSRASCGCSRPGWASAPAGPRCGWPST